MKAGLTLVLGGARSGKSAFAENLVANLSQVLYVATAQAVDPEMEERIAIHRGRRPAGWSTLEVEGALVDSLAGHLADHSETSDPPYDAFLLDSLDLYLSVQDRLEFPEDVLAEIDDFLSFVGEMRLPAIIVSCEAGMGVVPPFPAGRAFRDLLGLANQRVAAEADDVYLVVAGLPLQLKRAHARALAEMGGRG